MGGSLSHVLQSPGGLININSSHQKVSDMTRELIYELFDVLKANPRVSVQKIEGLLTRIPKVWDSCSNFCIFWLIVVFKMI